MCFESIHGNRGNQTRVLIIVHKSSEDEEHHNLVIAVGVCRQ